jgi:hypothetical protein
MSNLAFCRILFPILILACVVASGHGQAMPTMGAPTPATQNAQPATDLSLIAVAGPRETQAGDHLVVFNVGLVNTFDPTPLEHVYKIKNTGKIPVVITKIQEDAPCLDWRLGNGETLPFTLPAGGEIPVTVDLNPFLYKESLRHDVNIYINNQQNPIVSLTMTGFTKKVLTFTPPGLIFAPLPPDSQASLPLTISAIPEFAQEFPNIGDLRLVSNSPDVTLAVVSPKNNGKTIPPAAVFERLVTPDASISPTEVRMAFTVHLKAPADFGIQRTLLRFIRPGMPNLQDLRGANIPVTYEVRGPIWAKPAGVNLVGAAAFTEPQTITIYAADRADLNGLKVVSTNADLTVTLLPAEASTPVNSVPDNASSDRTQPLTAKLQVLLKSHETRVETDTEVVLQNARGKRLHIPITVVSPPATN